MQVVRKTWFSKLNNIHKQKFWENFFWNKKGLLCRNVTLKPLLHDQVFFDKFHVSNVFWACKLGIFKFVKNFTWLKNIWHKKFVKENL